MAAVEVPQKFPRRFIAGNHSPSFSHRSSTFTSSSSTDVRKTTENQQRDQLAVNKYEIWDFLVLLFVSELFDHGFVFVHQQGREHITSQHRTHEI